jgi:hypothetical protein
MIGPAAFVAGKGEVYSLAIERHALFLAPANVAPSSAQAARCKWPKRLRSSTQSD